MNNLLIVAAFAVMITELSCKKGKRILADSSDAEPGVDYDKYLKKIDLRGTVRQRFGLIATLQDSNNNSVCSPLSALLPLGKLALGARGVSFKELEKAIGVPTDESLESDDSDERYSHLSETFKTHLTDLIENLKSVTGGTLDVASRLYVSEDKRIYKKYTKRSKTIFKTSIGKVNYKDSVALAESINQWVSKKTHGMISNITSQQDVSPSSSLVIVNAIYFTGNWLHAFKRLELKPFYSEENVREIMMMSNVRYYSYLKSDTLDAQLMLLPYVENNSSFLLVVPNKKNGLQSLLSQLKKNPELLAQEIDKMHWIHIRLTIPKFRIESQWNLKTLYQEVGLNSIFDRHKSGLSDIVRKEKLHVSAAIQKVVIDVTELGETMSPILLYNSFGVEPIEVTVDRPFLFYVMANAQQLLTGVFKFRVQKVNKSFMGLSIRVYNKIPQDVLNLPLGPFKTKIENILLKKAYYNVQEFLVDQNVWNEVN